MDESRKISRANSSLLISVVSCSLSLSWCVTDELASREVVCVSEERLASGHSPKIPTHQKVKCIEAQSFLTPVDHEQGNQYLCLMVEYTYLTFNVLTITLTVDDVSIL